MQKLRTNFAWHGVKVRFVPPFHVHRSTPAQLFPPPSSNNAIANDVKCCRLPCTADTTWCHLQFQYENQCQCQSQSQYSYTGACSDNALVMDDAMPSRHGIGCQLIIIPRYYHRGLTFCLHLDFFFPQQSVSQSDFFLTFLTTTHDFKIK